MGCMQSSPALEALLKKPEFRLAMRQFEGMHLYERDIRRLHRVFERMDTDKSNSIGMAELLGHIDLPRTAYTEKIFTIFDKDKSGAIDFREFVLSVWNYCTLTKLNLDIFAFDLYDDDGSGELSPSEVLKLIQDIFGKSEMKSNVHAKSINAELNAYEEKHIKFDAQKFHTFMLSHQAMLFPAFQVQQGLQRQILGTAFWDKQTAKRQEQSAGEYISINQYVMGIEFPGDKKENNNDENAFSNSQSRLKHGTSIHSQASSLSLSDQISRHNSRHNSRNNSRHSSSGNFTSSFVGSAKMRFDAGVQGVTEFLSGKHNKKKKAKQVKVHPNNGVLPPTDTSFVPASASPSKHSSSHGHGHGHSSYHSSSHSSSHGHSQGHSSSHNHSRATSPFDEPKGGSVTSPVVSPRQPRAHSKTEHGHGHGHEESSPHNGKDGKGHGHSLHAHHHSPSHVHRHHTHHHQHHHSQMDPVAGEDPLCGSLARDKNEYSTLI